MGAKLFLGNRDSWHCLSKLPQGWAADAGFGGVEVGKETSPVFSGFIRADLGQQGQTGPAGPMEVTEDTRARCQLNSRKKIWDGSTKVPSLYNAPAAIPSCRE